MPVNCDFLFFLRLYAFPPKGALGYEAAVKCVTTVGKVLDVARACEHLKTHLTVIVNSYLLGIEITHTPTGIELNQRQCITNNLTCL